MNSTITDLDEPPKNGKLSFITHYKDELHLFAFLLIYLATWTLLMAWLPLSMNADDIEQVVWSRTWQWGYYKHPPLPSLLMYGLSHLFGGPSKGLTAFAAQGCDVVALIYVWLLAKQLLPRKLAIVAVLITSLISYYSFRAVIFNHNTVSFPFTAALLYYFYCAIQRPERLLTWLLLGIAGGLAMLTKYSAILVLASFILYVIWQQLWKNPLVIRGLLVSIVVFSLVFSPNIIWLVEHDWLPFHYLNHQLTVSDGNRLKLFGSFLGNLSVRWWYTLLAVLFLAKISRETVDTQVLSIGNNLMTASPQSYANPNNLNNDRRFLLAMLFMPLTLAMLPMLFNGNALNSNWISAFFFPAGILLIHCFFRHYDETRLLQNTSRLVWGIQIVILLVFVIGGMIYPAQVGRKARTNYPSQQLAETVSAIWREHQYQPLTIVIADNWLGGNVLLHTRPEPLVLIDNNTTISPWLNRQDVAVCGALVLTTVADKATPAYADLFSTAVATGTFSLIWGRAPQGEVMNYAWAILPPEPNAICRFHVD
jgi:4-amino-4-deoxy-L-arabinose transferase-like glycosyltransferase